VTVLTPEEAARIMTKQHNCLIDVAEFFCNQNLILDTEAGVADEIICQLEESQPLLEERIVQQLKDLGVIT
jgi:hypothetical protein